MKKTRDDYPNNWEEISEKIKKRDGYRCRGRGCGLYFGPDRNVIEVDIGGGRTKWLTFGVHHKDRNTNNNEDDNLISLCSSCHRKAELPLIRKELRKKKHKDQLSFFKNLG